MTQRSILAGAAPNVIIKAGGSVTVRGHESERVAAETTGRWGLKVEPKTLRVSETLRVLIEVQIGGSGEVFVPYDSNLKVYAGRDIDAQGIHGRVDAYSGYKMSLKDVYRLGHASAGGSMDIDCQTMAGERAEFKAGSDIRFHVRDLTSAHIRVKDLGGYWEVRIGAGDKSVSLKSGGDVTLVTDQEVEPLPPNFILGKVEKPASAE